MNGKSPRARSATICLRNTSGRSRCASSVLIQRTASVPIPQMSAALLPHPPGPPRTPTPVLHPPHGPPPHPAIPPPFSARGGRLARPADHNSFAPARGQPLAGDPPPPLPLRGREEGDVFPLFPAA